MISRISNVFNRDFANFFWGGGSYCCIVWGNVNGIIAKIISYSTFDSEIFVLMITRRYKKWAITETIWRKILVQDIIIFHGLVILNYVNNVQWETVVFVVEDKKLFSMCVFVIVTFWVLIPIECGSLRSTKNPNGKNLFGGNFKFTVYRIHSKFMCYGMIVTLWDGCRYHFWDYIVVPILKQFFVIFFPIHFENLWRCFEMFPHRSNNWEQNFLFWRRCSILCNANTKQKSWLPVIVFGHFNGICFFCSNRFSKKSQIQDVGMFRWKKLRGRDCSVQSMDVTREMLFSVFISIFFVSFSWLSYWPNKNVFLCENCFEWILIFVRKMEKSWIKNYEFIALMRINNCSASRGKFDLFLHQ